MPTGKEMCETVAEALRKKYPDKEDLPKPEDLWNASPTGDLIHVFSLYYWAKFYLKKGRDPTNKEILQIMGIELA